MGFNPNNIDIYFYGKTVSHIMRYVSECTEKAVGNFSHVTFSSRTFSPKAFG
jgi:hypothetical protein